jgi:hypothetical protein
MRRAKPFILNDPRLANGARVGHSSKNVKLVPSFPKDAGHSNQGHAYFPLLDPSFTLTNSMPSPVNSQILCAIIASTRSCFTCWNLSVFLLANLFVLLPAVIIYLFLCAALAVGHFSGGFLALRPGGLTVRVRKYARNDGKTSLLNLAMLIRSKGVNTETVLKLMRLSPPPHYEEQLLDDLLRKRNRHLLEELHARLPQTEHIIVPWGVAHMPEIAKDIQKTGFRLVEAREYVGIRFGSAGKETQTHRESRRSGKTEVTLPLPIKWIAARVQTGTAKGAKSVLHHLAQSQDQRKTASALEPCAQLEF